MSDKSLKINVPVDNKFGLLRNLIKFLCSRELRLRGYKLNYNIIKIVLQCF